MNIKPAILTVAILAAGCSILEPRPDNSRFFILTPIADGVTPVALSVPAASIPTSIGVGPIEFPDYLRRQQVVTRSAPNKLELSEESRWAEPLDKNFTRVLCENMAELLNVQRIEKYPWPRKYPVDYQVTIEVQRFETTTDRQAHLLARWAIKEGPSGRDLYRSQTSATEPVGTEESAASAALSRGLAVLSRDIASHLTELQQARIRSAAAPIAVPKAAAALMPADHALPSL
jgi:uncharacterized lipoprotein YmbA